LAYSGERPVGGTGDGDAAMGMARKDDAVQILMEQQVGYIGDMRIEADLGGEQMAALAEAGQSRRVDVVSLGAQQPRDSLIALAAISRAVDEDIGCDHRPSMAFNHSLTR
jgi:hypothetical protein